MDTFKPTHRFKGGELLELEHVFTQRNSGVECGLFHLENGSYVSFQMDYVKKLPKTIHVATHEEPEPLRVAPEVGSTYWILSSMAEEGALDLKWTGDKTDRRILAAGEARATKEDALAARAARQKARGFAS